MLGFLDNIDITEKQKFEAQFEDLPPNLVADDSTGLGHVEAALDEEQQINDMECSSSAPV